jgi:hypothetical protein
VPIYIIRNCGFSEIINWNSEDRLQELVINDCFHLIKFPALNKIPLATLSIRKYNCDCFEVGEQSELLFSGLSLSIQSMSANLSF